VNEGGDRDLTEIRDKRIIIDGKPVIIMCGEIHYFRLKRHEWQDRIEKLKAAGCNAIASYIPWICHEPVEGQVDLYGNTRPELDLDAFIRLCEENDLYIVLRPGPFIMAEMKNEGIPFWVYEKHPEIVPVTWDGKPVTTKTIDYLAPGFLQEVRKWYKHVMPLIAKYIYPNGGKIIGVQLDNEIGMLSWVSNSPDLTDFVLEDFASWLKNRYSADELAKRYPIDFDDFEDYCEKIRSPQEEYAVRLLHDLGYYMRNRYARYVNILSSYAREFGIKGIPFFINIHGTGGGRGLTYPIGVSQLYESYAGKEGFISGSDIYLGDLTMNNFQDLYLINAFTDAVNSQDQPLTCLEFECGDGNYGCTLGGRYDPSAADFKTRMCIAQGNRMLNYYLFAGGTNYVLEPKPNDGNNRIAFTGQRHGFAAPISPEGELNYTYFRMARTIKAVGAVSDKLADMDEERDGVFFAFIPDYYMTEYYYPGSTKSKEFVQNLEQRRSGSAWEIVARAMLNINYRFGSIDVQNRPLDPKTTPCLVIPSGAYMSMDLQIKLADFLKGGGNVLFYGELPVLDMEGNPCTVLVDALGVRVSDFHKAGRFYYLSVYADGWAAPRPEIRVGYAQTYKLEKGEAIMRVAGNDEICGFDVTVGNGRAIVLGTNYNCDISLFKAILERLGQKPGLYQDNPYYGIFMTSTANKYGERFIHLLNLDGFEKEFNIFDDDTPMFEGSKISLQPREGVMLPINVQYGDFKIIYSTAEIMGVDKDKIRFRLTQKSDKICLDTERGLLPSQEYKVEKKGGKTYIISLKDARADDQLELCFAN
jgi:beta-galactosidase